MQNSTQETEESASGIANLAFVGDYRENTHVDELFKHLLLDLWEVKLLSVSLFEPF